MVLKMDDKEAALTDDESVAWMEHWMVFVEENAMVEHAVHEMVDQKVYRMGMQSVR